MPMKRILLIPSTIFCNSQSFTLRREKHLRTASPPIKTDVPPEPVNEWQDRNPLCNVLNKMVSLVCVNRCDLPPVHKSLLPQFYPGTD
ncbi:hypothetical protein CDAR_242491 [Caerostris darwini]|uniref:Uncharacterized protein n=1 Tax=Caerostris darwini TaxID=1538125 RepID=A0AAV4UMW4_9ARAC|nr:hypothetical protein CDAR_242491 [Caerostris darwini]